MATETWVKASGTWREASEVWIKDSGTWRSADEVWVKASGTWRQVFSAIPTPISVTVNNISVSVSDTVNTWDFSSAAVATVNPPDTGGDYTYSWTKVSGGTISNTGGDNPSSTFSASLTPGNGNTSSVGGTYRCTVTNSKGSVSDDFTVFFQYTDEGS